VIENDETREREAWRLWHVLQSMSDTLWERYESAFMGFCIEEMDANEYGASFREKRVDNESPF